MFGSGKIGESPVICQTLTSKTLAYKWYPYGQIHLLDIISPIIFNLAIRQTLTPSNIPTIYDIAINPCTMSQIPKHV